MNDLEYTNDDLLKKAWEDGVVVPSEMYEFIEVMIMGARKYEPNGWLEPDGINSDFTSMHNSMFHHLAESYSGSISDDESSLHPLLHLACRALMEYTIQRRRIRND